MIKEVKSMKKCLSIMMIFFTLLFSTSIYAHHKTANSMGNAIDELLTKTPLDKSDTIKWENKEEKTNGSIKILQAFKNQKTRKPCRELRFRIFYDSLLFRAKGLVCLMEKNN